MKNNFLLDTHVFIWAMEGHKRLPRYIKNKIADPQNKVFVSVATVWEIVIKRGLEKIKISFELEGSIAKAGLEILTIGLSHVVGVEKLPIYHKDPFDRILISQAKLENLTLITSDEKIWKYNTDVLRC